MLQTPPTLNLPDTSVDIVLLLAVLTCIPADEDHVGCSPSCTACSSLADTDTRHVTVPTMNDHPVTAAQFLAVKS